jgi:hypothetical protein
MKKIKNSIFGLIIAAACLPGSNASAVGSDPSIAKVTVFGIAVSKNQDCSGAVVVGYNPVGTVYDFLQKPSIVSGDIAAGTYQCVILYMNNLLTFTPLTSETGNAPGCVAATSYSRIICAASGCTFTKTSVDASNNLTYTGTGTPQSANSQAISTPEKVPLFLSTGSTGTGNNAFMQPTGATASVTSTNGIHLGAPFVVSATGGAGTFVVNFNGQVKSQGDGSCDLGPPTFTFR